MFQENGGRRNSSGGRKSDGGELDSGVQYVAAAPWWIDLRWASEIDASIVP